MNTIFDIFVAVASSLHVEPVVLAALLNLAGFALAVGVTRLRKPRVQMVSVAEPPEFQLELLPLSAISTCAQTRTVIEMHPIMSHESRTQRAPHDQLVLW